MRGDLAALTAILGMALATFATRAGGIWLMRRFTPPGWLAACLQHLPGAVLVALLAPAVLSGGWAEGAGAGLTLLVASRGGGLPLAAAAGVAAVCLARGIA